MIATNPVITAMSPAGSSHRLRPPPANTKAPTATIAIA
jgi:hypothetical protein